MINLPVLLALAGLVFPWFAPCAVAFGTNTAHSGTLFAGFAWLFEACASALVAVGVSSTLSWDGPWVCSWVARHRLAWIGSRRHHLSWGIGISSRIRSCRVCRWVGLRRVGGIALRRRWIGLCTRIRLWRVALGRIGRRGVVVRRLTHYYGTSPYRLINLRIPSI